MWLWCKYDHRFYLHINSKSTYVFSDSEPWTGSACGLGGIPAAQQHSSQLKHSSTATPKHVSRGSLGEGQARRLSFHPRVPRILLIEYCYCLGEGQTTGWLVCTLVYTRMILLQLYIVRERRQRDTERNDPCIFVRSYKHGLYFHISIETVFVLSDSEPRTGSGVWTRYAL